MGIAAVSVLCAQVAARGIRSAAREGSRGSDGNRRRLRRQRGLSIRHRVARCPSCDEVRASGKDGLRPHGGPGRDHKAPSIARPPSHCARRQRQIDRDGYRHRDRRRRVLHAFVHRAFARHAAFARPLCLPQRPYSVQCLGHQHCSLRRISRIRRTSNDLRSRTPHGRNRRRHRHRPRRISTSQLHPPGRNHSNRTVDARARHPRHAARSRASRERLLQQAGSIHARKFPQRPQARHGHRRFLSWFRVHGLRRTLSQLARGRRRDGRRQRARAGFKHRVWPGYQHRACASRCRNPRRRLRRRHHGPARHRCRSQQRTDRRLAHCDGDWPPH